MKPVTVRERKNIWKQMDSLHAETGYQREDDGFTVREYAERYRLSNDGADGRLRKLEQQGKLVRGWSIRSGYRVKVYRFPEAP